MRLKVKLFAKARDLAGSPVALMELPEGATVGRLRDALSGAIPALASLLARSTVAVDGEHAADHVVLTAASEVAVLPPVSGG